MLAQPINTLSGIVYLLAGAWILARASVATGRRWQLVVFGLATSTNAVGGLLYHGLQWPAARWVHDVAILGVLLFVVAFQGTRLAGRPEGSAAGAYATLLVVSGSLLAAAPEVATPLFGLTAVAAITLELAEQRRSMPRLRTEGFTRRRLARASVVAVLALAVAAFLVGRSGGSLCDPASPFQWHATWHALTATAMALYAYGAIEPHGAGAATGTAPGSPRRG